jgi:hypothetical protein
MLPAMKAILLQLKINLLHSSPVQVRHLVEVSLEEISHSQILSEEKMSVWMLMEMLMNLVDLIIQPTMMVPTLSVME